MLSPPCVSPRGDSSLRGLSRLPATDRNAWLDSSGQALPIRRSRHGRAHFDSFSMCKPLGQVAAPLNGFCATPAPNSVLQPSVSECEFVRPCNGNLITLVHVYMFSTAHSIYSAHTFAEFSMLLLFSPIKVYVSLIVLSEGIYFQ